jgi:oligosaccharide translocation protein RFT1
LFTVLLLRIIDKESYGLSRIYFEFLFNLLLFFPRETMRKTCQKYSAHTESKVEESRFYECCQLNGIISYIASILSITLLGGFIYLYPSIYEYLPHLIIYVLAALIELYVEPVILYMNLKIESQQRIVCMIMSNYTKVISNFIYAYLGLNLWSFSLSRLTSCLLYSTYLFYVSIFKFNLDVLTFFPSIRSIFNVSKELKEVFSSFVKNSLLKMILANLEKFLLGFFIVISDIAKAEFSFVVDNFSIISRMLLEPVEENFFNLISKLKSSGNEKETSEKKKGLLEKAVRIMLIFGTLVFVYASLVGKNAIQFLYTDKWATDNSINIIKIYSFYLGLTSINGIIESYTNASISEQMMSVLSKSLIFNSGLMLILSIYLSKNCVTGLVQANIVCVIIRIIFNLFLLLSENGKDNEDGFVTNTKSTFIKIFKFFYESFYQLKSFLIILLSILSICFLKNIMFIYNRNFIFLVLSGIIFLINCLGIYVCEKKDFKELMKIYKNKD